jgi:hypothetical protein
MRGIQILKFRIFSLYFSDSGVRWTRVDWPLIDHLTGDDVKCLEPRRGLGAWRMLVAAVACDIFLGFFATANLASGCSMVYFRQFEYHVHEHTM